MINYQQGVTLDVLDLSEKGIDRKLQWRNDPRIRDWCRQNDLIQRADHLKWIESLTGNPSIKMYSVKTRLTHKIGEVGVAGLTSIDLENRRAEFSLYIGPEYQRMGYATAALNTLVCHAFSGLGLQSVWGETVGENKPVIKIMKTLGFKKDGLRRDFYYRNGEYVDSHLYSITIDDWIKL